MASNRRGEHGLPLARSETNDRRDNFLKKNVASKSSAEIVDKPKEMTQELYLYMFELSLETVWKLKTACLNTCSIVFVAFPVSPSWFQGRHHVGWLVFHRSNKQLRFWCTTAAT